MAEKRITGNFFACNNEVFVEGKSIGKFASIEIEQDRKEIANKATIEMPFYSIATAAAKETSGSSIAVKRVGKYSTTYIRINPDDWNIKVGASIQIYGWYEDNEALGQNFDKLLLFDGYIRSVEGGFPTRIKCEDCSFALRFGTVNQSFTSETKIAALLQSMCDISNEAFAKYRKDNGLTAPVPKLVPDGKSMDSGFVLKPAAAVSPYDVISQVVVGMYKLYSNVHTDTDAAGNSVAYVYAGLGISDSNAPAKRLDTSVNVIGRSITPTDNLFRNFRVTVRWIEDGGLKSYSTGSDNGIPYEIPLMPGRNSSQMKTTAESALSGLRVNRNKGTITTLLYPEVKMFDYVEYTDTIFSTLSGRYYVIGRKITCGGSRGFYQTLTVTDETLLFLG